MDTFNNTLSFAVYKGMVLAKAYNGSLIYGLSIEDGSVVKEFELIPFQGLAYDPIQRVGDKLLFSARGRMTLFDPEVGEAGKSEWWFRPSISSYRAPMIYRDVLVLGGAGDRAGYVVGLDSGEEVARMLFPHDRWEGADVESVRTVWVDDSGFYFLGADGGIYAYEFDCPQFEGRWKF